MANNYCQSSSFISIPDTKLEQARKIVERVQDRLFYDDEGYMGFTATIEKNGVWIFEDDYYITPEHIEQLVRALVEELDLPGVHVCSWAYTCSKPRINEFGGGAFAVQKGYDTVWIDAASEAERIMLQKKTQ